MALIHCDFFSDVLGSSTAMTVILPQQTRRPNGVTGDVVAQAGRGHRTLYLLHGLSDDHTMWLRRTSIERYVEDMELAVVMPNAGRSWYTDADRGQRYWTFISAELPTVARSLFPLSDAREDNYVAGLSMGGYGAFKLAMRCPDRFAAAASLSGALDRAGDWLHKQPADPNWLRETENLFGALDAFAGSENDTMHLARQLAASSGPHPRLYQCCGTADFLYQQNVRFRDQARKLGLDLTCAEHESRGHDWGYWDQTIQDVLEWL